MSKSLDPARYPTAYMDLAARFEAAPHRAHFIDGKTPKGALALRLDLYGFQRAMKATAAADYPSFTVARMFLAGSRVRVVHPDHY